MTVSSTTSKVSYSGNGSTTAFAVSFYFLDDTHLKVVLRNADGSETVKTLNVDYTVSGAGNPSGGTVTMGTAPATGTTLVIVRNVPFTQETDYQANDPFPAETHERALDKLTMEVQQLNSAIGGVLRVPVTEVDPIGELPLASVRANKYLAFDASGNPVISNTSDVEANADRAEAAADAAQSSEDAAMAYAATAGAAAAIVSGVIPSFQQFSGTGSQTAFTVSPAPASKDAIDVYISGVYQAKSTYSLSGTTLTFTSAPPSGTNNIEVKVAPLVAYATYGAMDFGSIV